MRLDDITLMAYADGELAGSERDRVRELLRMDRSAMFTVADYRICRGIIERAYARIDFTRSSAEHRALTQTSPRHRFAGTKPNVGAARPTALSIDRSLGTRAALAASVMVALGLAATAGFHWYGKSLPTPYRTATGGGAIALGRVGDDVYLIEALSGRSPSRRVPTRNTQQVDTRFVPVADFYDKFGNLCREVEAMSPHAKARPSAVIVACRDKATGAWAVVGAAATSAPMTSGDVYAANEVEALESVRGILDMIGARRRTTAREVESKTR